MRASLVQMRVDPDEPVNSRRERAASLVRAESGAADLVVLPELWPTGAFAFRTFEDEAESVPGGPTATVMSEAAREAGVWLHAGSVIERAAPSGGEGSEGEGSEDEGPEGALYNTSLVFSPDGALVRTYRKIHRFGFDRGEATLLSAGTQPVTVPHPEATLGLATCYDFRFPELFRALVDAGARVLVVPAGWPEKRAEHWTLFARTRAVEEQAYVLACGTAGTHADVPQAGRSAVIDPWGEVLAEATDNEEQVVRAEFDPAQVDKIRDAFPVLKDRML